MNKKYKIVFTGTSDFALPVLQKLAQVNFVDLELVITQPDKPVGRKKEYLPSPVKALAQKLNLRLVQPEKIIEADDVLKEIKPDLGVIVSYGQIVPQKILDIPKYGWLNIHPSLLPKYRGPSPLQTTILNQDEETGVTLMLVDDKMDHGPIIASQKFEINRHYTYLELSQILAEIGSDLLIQNMINYIEGKIKPRPQDDSLASFTKIIKKEDGKIDWTKSADEIDSQIRAYSPWPSSYTILDNKRLKITSASPTTTKADLSPGQIKTDDNKFLVACKDNFLDINKLQLEGKKETLAIDFIQGYPKINDSTLK